MPRGAIVVMGSGGAEGRDGRRAEAMAARKGIVGEGKG